MIFKKSLLQATMIKRYKRFFADVRLNGQIVTAHCPNTGSLKSCWQEGLAAYVSESDNPERKLKYTLEITESPTGALVGVNTSWPNKLVKLAFEEKQIKDWLSFVDFKSEVKISAETRLDAVLTNKNGKQRFIEIKNVTLVHDRVAQFPDAETTRGQKHLRELMALRKQGHQAEIVFAVQRNDFDRFEAAKAIDPEYAKLLEQARLEGVIVRVLKFNVSQKEIRLEDEVTL